MAKKSSEVRDLITEQPAWAIISSGLLVSFFLGFAIKSYFNPGRLAERISQAANQVHPSVQINFESAVLSLSRWGLPRLEVVVSQVKATSSETCWGKPRVLIDEIRIPLSLRKMLLQEDPILGVELGAMQIYFAEAPKSCEKNKDTFVAAQKIQNDSAQKQNEKLKLETSKQGQGIRFLRVSGIQIHFDYEPRYYTELKNIQLQVLNQSPLRLTLDAGTELFKNEAVGDYLSNARFRAEYDESLDQSLLVHFFGNFREGYYSVIGKGSLSDRAVRLESELRNIPLGAVLSMLQRYGQSRTDVNANNLWLSLQAQSFFSIDRPGEAGLKISKVLIEGDLLELASEQISINRLEPLEYDPIKIDIKKLNIQKVFEFYGRPHPTKAMGQLGTFKGTAEVRSENEISLAGILSDLEFIFANKGLREIQTIESTLLDAQFLSGQWNLKLSIPKLSEGQLNGEMILKADRFLKNVQLEADIDELVLSPSVQKLMTQGGQIGPLQARLKWNLEDQKTQNIIGQVNLAETNVEGLKLKKASARIGYQGQSITVKSKVDELEISQGEPLKVMQSFELSASPVNFKQAQVEFLVDSAKSLRWKNALGILNDGTQLKSEGGWGEDGLLAGLVTTQKKNLAKKSWKIQGSRNSPVFLSEDKK